MTIRHRAVLLALALPAFAAPGVRAGTHDVFPGRRATAEVVLDGCEWRISVAFEPSRALGPGKSNLANQRLARDYALRGLVRELVELRGRNPGADAAPDAADASVSGFRTESSAEEGGLWRAQFAVPAFDGFADVEFSDGAFAQLLAANPFLMREGGAKVLRLPGGTNVLFSVGQTDARAADRPAVEEKRRRMVAAAQAKKSAAESIHAVRVRSFVQVRDTTVVRHDGENDEVLADMTELLERSESDVSGWIPGLPVVGTWILPEENLFCLAVGRFFPPAEETPKPTETKTENTP